MEKRVGGLDTAASAESVLALFSSRSVAQKKQQQKRGFGEDAVHPQTRRQQRGVSSVLWKHTAGFHVEWEKK